MTERRKFSRSQRAPLTEGERKSLLDAVLDEVEQNRPSTENTIFVENPAPPKVSDSFDALDALDAELNEESPHSSFREQNDPSEGIPPSHDELVEQAIAEIELEAATVVAPPAVSVIKATDQTVDDTTEVAGPEALGENQPEATETADHTEADVTEGTPPTLGLRNDQRVVSPPALPSEEAPKPPADPEVQKKLRDAYASETGEIVSEPADLWEELAVMPVNVPHLEENLVITASRKEPAHGAFDVLRTRLVHTLLEHGWKRVAITSPSRNCGKTFTAVNLAISLSRYESNRTVLLDMDMRNPSVADIIGDPSPGCMGDFLRGVTPAKDFLVKFDRNNLNMGPSLAIGTNNVIEPYAAELAQDPATGKHLDIMMQEMSPDIVLFDMPPALAFDDVIAFRQHFDGVLMVVGGGSTSPEEVREVMRRLGEETPLLGVVLNQAEGEDGSDYSYGY